MAPSVVKSRFHNTLDMVAARSMRNETVAQSGTDVAWCRGDSPDSPTLGHMALLPTGTRPQESCKPPSSSKSRLAVQRANVAPLNIKKIRRRALTNASSIDLGLPPSPLPPLSTGSEASASPSPLPTGLTFTAEWDLTKRSFVFTPLREGHSPSSSASSSPRSTRSSVPVNVDEDLLLRSTLPSPSLYSPSILSPHPDLSAVNSPVSDSPDSEKTQPAAPMTIESRDNSPSPEASPVSSIFDRDSLYSNHKRYQSRSSAASSVISLVDMELDTEKQKARRALPPRPDLDLDSSSSPLKALEKSVLATSECGVVRSASERSCGRPQYAQRPLPRIPRTLRRLPDVPRNAASMYESGSPADRLSMAGGSLRRHLQTHIKALSGSSIFKR